MFFIAVRGNFANIAVAEYKLYVQCTSYTGLYDYPHTSCGIVSQRTAECRDWHNIKKPAGALRMLLKAIELCPLEKHPPLIVRSMERPGWQRLWDLPSACIKISLKAVVRRTLRQCMQICNQASKLSQVYVYPLSWLAHNFCFYALYRQNALTLLQNTWSYYTHEARKVLAL